jgi:hypothetical protein
MQAVSKEVRNVIAARVDALDVRLGQARARDLASELQAIRRLAEMHRIGPALAVVDALEGAIARGERGPLVHGWLDILRDAIGCERRDEQARAAFAAACSVRLAS